MEIDINENNKNEEVTYLYHFIPIKYLILLIKNKKLRLRRICDWSDKWETFLFKHIYIDKEHKEYSAEKSSYSFYAQCWTKQENSNALWEIFSKDKLSIKIKTTKKKLEGLNTKKEHSLFLSDNVEYCSKENLVDWLSKHSKESIETFLQRQGKESLFKKRDEFQYEDEYRIVYLLDTQSGYDKEFYDIDIPDIDDFIEEYCIDPRVDETTENLIRIVLKHLNIPDKKIIKSDLYTFNKQHITIKP